MFAEDVTLLPDKLFLKMLEAARRDAILNEDGTRADWPDADVVIGNPPFLGAS